MTTEPYDTTMRHPHHTKEGLALFLSSSMRRPTLLSNADYLRLGKADRTAYNQSRHDYVSGGLTVNTPDMKFAANFMAKAAVANSQRPLGTNGLIVSGPPTVGKTTILNAIMKTTWARARKRHPDANGNHVPVVYVEVPSGSTGRLLMVEFARFFGLTVTRADTKDQIEHRVINALYAARTELIVMDELHNLEASNRGNGESINALKVLQDKVRADFVLAGIKLEQSPLLSGTKGAQIGGRFAALEVDLFDLTDPDSAAIWGGIIDAFEKTLPLHGHKPGTLQPLIPYLHQRTNGNISSLNMLLSWAAHDLIRSTDGQPEILTKALLDEQVLDLNAERHYKKVRSLMRTRKNQNTETPTHG